MTLAPGRTTTCATCGKTEPWTSSWRWGSDDGRVYINPHLGRAFCSEECERKAVEKYCESQKAVTW